MPIVAPGLRITPRPRRSEILPRRRAPRIAPGLQAVGEVGIGERQHARREQRGVDRPGLPDGERPDRNARRHLHDREKTVLPVERARRARHAEHRQVVNAAVIPGRCAAPPAPAMMTLKPAARAPLAKATMRSGVRCAETMRASYSTSSSSSVSAAWRIVAQSDWDPMMIAIGAATRVKRNARGESAFRA